MEIYQIFLLIGAGMICGFINTVAGGGSLISLPILIFLGLPANIANGTNRIALIAQNIFAVTGFRRQGIQLFPFNLYLGVSASFGAVIGAWFSAQIPAETFKQIIAVIMIGVVIVSLFNVGKTGLMDERIFGKYKTLSIIAFFFIGIYGGFIQIGIGFIMIAALSHINHLSLVKTNSVKVFVALIYSTAAIVIFIIEGQVNWVYGLTLAIGNSAGGWFASQWSVKKGDRWIKRVVLISASVMAIKMLIDTF